MSVEKTSTCHQSQICYAIVKFFCCHKNRRRCHCWKIV